MAVAAGCFLIGQPGGRAGRVAWSLSGVAGSLVLRRRDRPGHKRDLVRAKKHGNKSASGTLLSGVSLWDIVLVYQER